MKEEQQKFALIAIVGIVAIVAMVVLVISIKQQKNTVGEGIFGGELPQVGDQGAGGIEGPGVGNLRTEGCTTCSKTGGANDCGEKQVCLAGCCTEPWVNPTEPEENWVRCDCGKNWCQDRANNACRCCTGT